MLCDDIIADRLPFLDFAYDRKAVEKFMAKIGEANKFVLARDFAQAADEISNNLSDIAKALPFCRLPYPLTWIEVAQADRAHFLHGSDPEPWQGRPRRVGYLLEATREDLSAWKAHLAWHIAEGEMHGNNAAAMAMLIDVKAPPVPQTQQDKDRVEKIRREQFHQESAAKSYAEASDEVKDALAGVFKPTVPDFGVPMTPTDIDPEKIARALQRVSVGDWSGEIQFMLATMALLNARNASETFTVDTTTYNRKRIKAGKKPLFLHKILAIHSRQKAKMKSVETGGENAAVRAHFVRGHWKVRRTGIYFWRPFVRGKAGFVHKDYVVAD